MSGERGLEPRQSEPRALTISISTTSPRDVMLLPGSLHFKNEVL